MIDLFLLGLYLHNFSVTNLLVLLSQHVNDLSYRLNLDEILMRATAIYNHLEQSTNLTASTQRVLGLSNDIARRKKNSSSSSEEKRLSDLSQSDINVENGYDTSIEMNYF